MGRNVVIGLAAVVALLVIAVVGVMGRDWIGGLMSGGHETPTVMVISSDLLETSVQSTQAKIVNAAAAKVDSDAQKKAAEAKTSQPADARSAAQMQADDLSLVVQAMQDSLGGKISEALQNSNRFQLVASSKVVDEMDDYAKENHTTSASLLSNMSGALVGASETPRGGSANSVSGKSSVLTHGLPEIGRRVGADYVIVVTIGEPRFSQEVLLMPDSTLRLRMIAQPIVDCEIFQTNGKLDYRFSDQIEKPVVEAVDDYSPDSARTYPLFLKFLDHLHAAVAQQVLAWALDKIAPARILQTDGKLIINRGANDGVAQGATYQVEREVGDPVREGPNGANLGRVRAPVGQLFIETAQERLSTASVASGGPFRKDDIVDVKPAAKPAPQPGKPGSLNVAVDHIRAGGVESAQLAQSVADTLAADGRIAVLPRAELADLQSERARNARASDNIGFSSDEGLRVSDYLVDGDCASTSERHVSYISVDGVSQPSSSHVTAHATCTLRATAVDGRLVGTAHADGGSTGEAAAAAARQLLATIAPSSGSAAAAPPEPVPPPAQAPQAGSAAPAPARPKVAAQRRPAAGGAPKSSDETSGIHF